jgi:endonuclease/exonuclease/phosphatase family metal-dependent hydrolase
MRTRIVIILLAVATLSACASSREQAAALSASARIMSYNIHAGYDLQRGSNLERVAALIDSLSPDVVLLQEVDRSTARSGKVDQAAVLSQRTGMHFVFGRAMDYDGGEYGIAVLSRFPVVTSRVVPLMVPADTDSAVQAAEPRVMLHVVMAAPQGELHVVNTHLDHRAQSVARNAQVLQLLAYGALDVPKSAPLVLGGDMNARPDAMEVRALGAVFDDAWLGCGTGAGHTFRADQPDRRIDYLMLVRVRCTRAQVIATEISDHRPLIVDVLIRPASK